MAKWLPTIGYALLGWVTEPAGVPASRNEFVLKVYSLWLAEPRQAVAFVRAREAQHRDRLDRLESTAPALEQGARDHPPRPADRRTDRALTGSPAPTPSPTPVKLLSLNIPSPIIPVVNPSINVEAEWAPAYELVSSLCVFAQR